MIDAQTVFKFKVIEEDLVYIEHKLLGNLGSLVFQEKFKMWTFFPIENFFYKPVHIALILKQMNKLNGYKKEEKK